MDQIRTKPKLVFFQYKYHEHLPSFLLMHKREHVRCLSEFFDVTAIHDDCDYRQICDLYEPDLTLFEGAYSGVDFSFCQRQKIINTHACQQIPKLGLLHADAFCRGRSGFLSDMDRWGIDTFFAIATTTAQHMPAIADRLFIWPNFVDPAIHCDYGQHKCVPVLFTGATTELYPWRRKIIKLVSNQYPSLLCPHPGYGVGAFSPTDNNVVREVKVGEPYARMINASWFVPACGTVARDVVRKHFEVPACRACLITEQSPALEGAGFVDMKNCVFADEHTILDKLAYLFCHRDELEAIIDAGYALVRARHTLKQRDQVLQWFDLYKKLQPNQKIIQSSPFASLRIVDSSLQVATSHGAPHGLHLALIREGDAKLKEGKYKEAEDCYLRSASCIRWMPEPQLKLGVCNLYKGDAQAALSWIMKPLEFTLGEYKAVDPDPVEWAYLVLSLLCLGRLDDAVRRCGEFAWLRHPELDRARWVTAVLSTRGGAVPWPPDSALKYRVSIHQVPVCSFGEWIQDVCVIFRACGRCDIADDLSNCLAQGFRALRPTEGGLSGHRETPPGEGGEFRESRLGPLPCSLVRRDAFGFFERRLLFKRLKARARRGLERVLHGLEIKWSYFLPYRLSESKNDEFFRTVRHLAQDQGVKTALIIGAAAGQPATEALLAGAWENDNKPSVFCVSSSERRLSGPHLSKPRVKWYGLVSFSLENLCEELKDTVKRVMEEHQVNFFDVVLIDGSELRSHLADDVLSNAVYRAGIIMLNDIDSGYVRHKYSELLVNPDYELVDYDLDLRNGYAIFKKRNAADGKASGALFSTSLLTE